MTPDEYTRYDATGLAELVAKGETTPSELLDAALAATARVNDALNAVVARFPEDAAAGIAAGLPDGPFRGVPFLLKDLTASYGGRPTGSGWAPRLTYNAAADSELVARFKRAGLSIFGKTAVPELAMDWTTRSPPHGITRNPWNPDCTAGTSSGGSAAAVAARIVPMAHGNDGGGSLRVPASCCGVFALKPTRGRNPAAPAGATWQGMLVEHALTRSVRDSAALLDATEGSTAGQFYNSPPRAHLTEALYRAPDTLRIGVLTDAPYGATTHRDCLDAVDDVVRLLSDLGHDCAPMTLTLPQNGWSSFETCILAEYATDIAIEEQVIGRNLGAEDFTATLWEMIESGRRVSAVEQNMAFTGLHDVTRAVNAAIARFDVIISPVLAQPPLPHGAFPEAPHMRDHFNFYLSWMPYTHIFNVSGAPAMSVPLVWNKKGLPVGVQFAALPGEEARLVSLAAQLETARPWADKLPTIHA